MYHFYINNEFRIAYYLYNHPLCRNNMRFIVLKSNNSSLPLLIDNENGTYKGIILNKNQFINILNIAINNKLNYIDVLPENHILVKFQILIILSIAGQITLDTNMLTLINKKIEINWSMKPNNIWKEENYNNSFHINIQPTHISTYIYNYIAEWLLEQNDTKEISINKYEKKYLPIYKEFSQFLTSIITLQPKGVEIY